MAKRIKTEEQYQDALARLYKLMQNDVKEGSETSDEMEALSILIKDYEMEHYPIPSPNS